MSRAFLKTGLGVALTVTATDRLIGAISGVRRLPLIVGYHRVVDTLADEDPATTPAMAVSVSMFVRQLEWIGQRYRFVSLDEIGARLESGESWTTPVATVTFDDGYRDVYRHAFPVLLDKGIPASVFVITDAIGTSRLLMHDRIHRLLARDWPRARGVLERLGVIHGNPAAARSPFNAMRFLLSTRPQGEIELLVAVIENRLGPLDDVPDALLPMTWDMVARMHRAGITIGSHTRTHPVLTNEEPARVLDELISSRDAIRHHLGATVAHFAYPDGAFEGRIAAAAAAAGYRYAYTTCCHRDPDRPLLTIPRRFLWENSSLDARGRFSPAVMGCLTNGVYDLAVSCRRHHAIAPGDRQHLRTKAARAIL